MPMIARYALVTLAPLFLIAIGATFWGGAGVLALLWLTVIAAVFDSFLTPPKPDTADQTPWSDRLSLALGVGHLLLLPVVLIGLIGPWLGFGEWIALFLAAASFFGQVSHPNAHELIHRRQPLLRGVGAAVYTSLGFGHHVSAHRLIHHRHVGTTQDPNTPLPGEGFWGYLPRALSGSFEAGFLCELDRLERRGLPETSLKNPYVIWVAGAALAFMLAIGAAGIPGAFAWMALAAAFGAQILLSDYVQHYGLQRLELPNGRVEPVAPHHSWNAPKGFSSFLMMNAPAHSEHHMHPDRPYDVLSAQTDMPILPMSLPIMAMVATLPPVWRRMMDRRALLVMEAAQARLFAGTDGRPEVPDLKAAAPENDDMESMIARVARATQ